jgi:hypothetical protein
MSNNKEANIAAKAAKKAASAAGKDPDGYALTNSIVKISKQMETFPKVVAECKELIEGQLQDIELRTNMKRKAMDALDEEFEQRKKSRRIDLEQDLRAYGYAEALKVIKEHKQTPVPDDELAKLKAELDLLRQDNQQKMDQLLAQERSRYEKDMKTFQITSDLRHETEVAKMEASVKQLQDHIKVLENTIASQKQDIDKQRELTRSVAESARPQPQYVMGKN